MQHKADTQILQVIQNSQLSDSVTDLKHPSLLNKLLHIKSQKEKKFPGLSERGFDGLLGLTSE